MADQRAFAWMTPVGRSVLVSGNFFFETYPTFLHPYVAYCVYSLWTPSRVIRQVHIEEEGFKWVVKGHLTCPVKRCLGIFQSL